MRFSVQHSNRSGNVVNGMIILLLLAQLSGPLMAATMAPTDQDKWLLVCTPQGMQKIWLDGEGEPGPVQTALHQTSSQCSICSLHQLFSSTVLPGSEAISSALTAATFPSQASQQLAPELIVNSTRIRAPPKT